MRGSGFAAFFRFAAGRGSYSGSVVYSGVRCGLRNDGLRSLIHPARYFSGPEIVGAPPRGVMLFI